MARMGAAAPTIESRARNPVVEHCRHGAHLRRLGSCVDTLSLIARAAAALLIVLVAGCGSPEAAPSARVEKVFANVRGIT
jgi:hypothetical protein